MPKSRLVKIEFHGKKPQRLYQIWIEMRRRCKDKNRTEYPRYGGRGIKVCDEWNNSFIKFKNWALDNGYKSNLSIDRIKNNLGYNSLNCKWSTPKEQARNRRNNVLTLDKVILIRKKYIPKEYGYRKVGKEFGVSNFLVRNVIKNLIWI